MPSLRHTRRRRTKATEWKKNSIVYICGMTRLPFGPNDMNLGGSEQAVVQLTKFWASHGFQCVVYGNVKECNQDGVEYIDIHKLNLQDSFQTAIFWRSFGIRLLPLLKAKKRIVDLHDSWDPKQYVSMTDLLDLVDVFMVKSQYHKSLYPYIPSSKLHVLMNGIQIPIFKAPSVERKPYRIIYASNYERGLEPILKYTWSLIKRAIPEAEFHIFYGFQPGAKEEYMSKMKKLFKQPGVFEHGKVSLQRIAREKYESAIHFYLSNSVTEIDCISIRESLLCGAVPVIGEEFVFSEREGVHVKGSTKNMITYKKAASVVIGLLKHQTKLENIRKTLLQKTKTIISWKDIAKQWIPILF